MYLVGHYKQLDVVSGGRYNQVAGWPLYIVGRCVGRDRLPK